MSHDEISNPKHYDLFPDGMQAIDVIEAALTPEEFAGYLKGNFLKYRLRAGEKGPAEKCIGKAEWYRDRLADHHDFMNSEAITRADHARLKAEDEAKAANADWPNEQRRQDAEAEDEAWKAVEASQQRESLDFPCAPSWDSHSWPQIVKDEDGNWWGVKAGWKMSISHGFKGDYFSILNGDGEFLKRGADPVNWRRSLQQRPYTGHGGVMIQCPGCVATSCECRP